MMGSNSFIPSHSHRFDDITLKRSQDRRATIIGCQSNMNIVLANFHKPPLLMTLFTVTSLSAILHRT